MSSVDQVDRRECAAFASYHVQSRTLATLLQPIVSLRRNRILAALHHYEAIDHDHRDGGAVANGEGVDCIPGDGSHRSVDQRDIRCSARLNDTGR